MIYISHIKRELKSEIELLEKKRHEKYNEKNFYKNETERMKIELREEKNRNYWKIYV
jgi:hypothetical protein